MTKTILILAANPKNTARLRLDQEVREIDNGLQRARRRDEFILKQVWAVRRPDFRRAMLDLKPNIVHFCGHGSGEEGIAFEDENGQAKLISTEALSGFFELFADTVECVVLNACYSEAQAEAIAKHIPHVVGMNKAIGDTAAIEFSIAFYDALGAGESIEFAYKLACNAIQLSGMPENLTPILKSMRRPPKQVAQKEKSQLNFQLTPKLPLSNYIHQVWDKLEPDLQDALALAYNQAQRDGGNEIKTRYFFAALARLRPASIAEFLNRIPAEAMPKPVNESVSTKKILLEENPLLSPCVDDSLRHLSPKVSSERKLSSADVLVDIAEHGTGNSVARFRRSGITSERVNEIVNELGWEVIRR